MNLKTDEPEEDLQDKLVALAALQKVDIGVQALRKSAEAYPKEIVQLEQQLAAARAVVDSERTKLDQLDTQRADTERQIGDERDKIRKWEGRLTEQRSTREYSALAREIDIAKKGLQTMSEDLGTLSKQAIIQRDTVRSKDVDFQAKAADLKSRIAVLVGQLETAQQKAAAVEATRGDVAKHVDRALLRQYDSIRRKRMPAMVPVNANGTCTGCRMNLRPQMYNTLVASRGIDVCPSCSRMVYADEVLKDSTQESK